MSVRVSTSRPLVIACSDSRVDPQTIFGAVPGELFVVRNVAALVPPYSPDPGHHGTSAALEFGVRVLKIPRLVVLGHGQCGGVRAMAYGPPPQARDFIASWVEIGEPALVAAGVAIDELVYLTRHGRPIWREPRGLAAGYVLGTRAGRQRYEQLTETVRKVKADPAVANAIEVVSNKAGELYANGRTAVQEKLGVARAERLEAEHKADLIDA